MGFNKFSRTLLQSNESFYPLERLFSANQLLWINQLKEFCGTEVLVSGEQTRKTERSRVF